MITQSKKITFKLSHINLINLDSKAESLGMNRSEFIKYCINQEMERLKNEAESKAKLDDFERLMQTLTEINSSVYKSIDASINTRHVAVKGIIQIQKALLELNPDNQNLISIFEGEK